MYNLVRDSRIKGVNMKILVIVVVIAVAVWAYMNVDFANVKNEAQNDAMNAVKNEKTIKKFIDSDQQGKNQLNNTMKQIQ